MGDPVNPQGMQARITQQYLQKIARGGVALEHHPQIGG
jgi:hypothetical protein